MATPTNYPNAHLTDADLIAALRKTASAWFKNSDLLLLEELIRRHQKNARKIAELEAELD